MFGEAELPDERLRRRLVDTMTAWAAQPGQSLHRACGTWAMSKGGYRLLANPRVRREMLSEAVFQEGCRLCEDQAVIYAVQDTSVLNLSHHSSVTGLGPINDESMQGLFLHSTLAVASNGQPLGLLDMQIWKRKKIGKKTVEERRALLRNQKESRKWFDGVTASTRRLEQEIPEGVRPRLVFVVDREGDMHELFEEVSALGHGLIARAAWNRRVAEAHGHLREQIASDGAGGRIKVTVPKRGNRPARTADLTLRWTRVTLSPRGDIYPHRKPISVWGVWVHESRPPQDQPALDWWLLSTEEVKDASDAKRVATTYTHRWRVEDFHRILKSGCRIEAHQFKSGERMQKVVVLLAALAVRILRITHLARTEPPQTPCTVVLSHCQWRALWTFIHQAPPPRGQPPPSLMQAVLWIGRMGGHLGRRRDGMPGVQSIWKGWRDLELLAAVYQFIKDSD